MIYNKRLINDDVVLMLLMSMVTVDIYGWWCVCGDRCQLNQLMELTRQLIGDVQNQRPLDHMLKVDRHHGERPIIHLTFTVVHRVKCLCSACCVLLKHVEAMIFSSHCYVLGKPCWSLCDETCQYLTHWWCQIWKRLEIEVQFQRTTNRKWPMENRMVM